MVPARIAESPAVTGNRGGDWSQLGEFRKWYESLGSESSSGHAAILMFVPERNIILKHWGVDSYADLMEMKPDEIVRLMDEKYTPVHEGDAFFAVVVMAALGEVRDTAKALDRAKRWFEIATVALAGAGLLVATLGVAVAVIAL